MNQNWKGLISISTVGLEFGVSILVGMFAGRWLDRKFDTAHWLTFLGFALGVAAGYRAIYRATQAANRQADREAEAEREARRHYHDDHRDR